MIVDTSALIAVTFREAEHERIEEILLRERGSIPAPVLVEFRRVIRRLSPPAFQAAIEWIDTVVTGSQSVEAFTADDAALAVASELRFGTGNRTGGTLNLIDLMVYGMAKRLDRPILCTGSDFAATDILIHPASRAW